jgi:general secretion pathway protein G
MCKARKPTFSAGSEDGFSLMELLVVLAIMGLLAGLVLPRVMGTLGKAKVQTTQSQIDLLATALDMFQVDNGRYPTASEGLQALVTRPPGLATWNGPYVARNGVPLDGWHHAFVYQSTPDGAGGFAIYSLGADGRTGGTGADADIGRSTLAQDDSGGVPEGISGASQ